MGGQMQLPSGPRIAILVDDGFEQVDLFGRARSDARHTA